MDSNDRANLVLLKKMVRVLFYILAIAFIGGEVGCRKVAIRPSYEELRPLLNSERIERVFGSYGIEVLEREPIRVSNLYSYKDGKRVCRTLAIVTFFDSIPEELSVPYQEIKQGSSLGATLKKAGWKVEKRHEHFGEITAGDRFRELAALEADSNDKSYALHIYTLWVEKNGENHPFSNIAEMHHPQYLKLEDLKKIYATNLEGNLEADTVDQQMIAIAQSASRN